MRVGISVRSERLMGGMGFHFHLNSSIAGGNSREIGVSLGLQELPAGLAMRNTGVD